MKRRPISISHVLKLLILTILLSALLGIYSEFAAAGCGPCQDGEKWCWTCCTGGPKGPGWHCGCPSWSGCDSECWQESCGGGGEQPPPPPPSPYCGDGTCDPGEDCSTCSTDCTCPPPTYVLCCDFQAADGSWYPSPPLEDASAPYACLLDDETYGLCRDGAGPYTIRTRFFQDSCPGGTLMDSNTKAYYCKGPQAAASMDGGVPGITVPCDASTSCVAEDTCYATGSTNFDADGDQDNDYCLNEEWYDCSTNAQCTGCEPVCNPGKDCVNAAEVCGDGDDNDCDGLTDEQDSDCCPWCETSGWQWNSWGGLCTGAGTFGWENFAGQSQWCCGNDAGNEAYETCLYVSDAGNTRIAWSAACDAANATCCLSAGCVDPNSGCYGIGAYYPIPGQTFDAFAGCIKRGQWRDCDATSGTCGGCAGATGWSDACGGNCWVKSGAAGVGEYDSVFECCGDDPSEYYSSGGAGGPGCCAGDNMILDATGTCQPCIPSGPEQCADLIDNDCDDYRDIADSDCSWLCANSGENNWWILGQEDCNQCGYAGNQDGDLCLLDADDADCDGAESICDDDKDNDCDEGADWADSDCSGLCGNTGEHDWFVLGDPGCNHCTDSVNNDAVMDSYTDYDDPDCCAECEAGSEAGIDWEFDGLDTCTDSSDFGWENPLEPKLQNQSCCGDDRGYEFFITRGVGPDMCCNATTDCVDLPGVCRIGSEFSPGGCTDQYDHDCDGKNNFDDNDPGEGGCRDSFYGTVKNDEDGSPIPDATVTAVAVDPITVLTDPPMAHVQYTTVTDINGYYEMNVTKGLDYDIVVVVPGYGTGFVWDHGPGNINFKIKKAENCEDDCTSPGESLCRPECHGINGCSFYGVGGAGGTRTCDGAKKDWIIPYFYDTDYELQCCEGAPAPRKRTQVVGVSGAKSVVRVTRIISYGGQLITLVIDVFK